jgi:hypothetical protein
MNRSVEAARARGVRALLRAPRSVCFLPFFFLRSWGGGVAVQLLIRQRVNPVVAGAGGFQRSGFQKRAQVVTAQRGLDAGAVRDRRGR